MLEDTKYSIICPACGKKMTKVRIPELNMLIDICVDSCGGVFFDNQELKKVQKVNEVLSKITKYLESKTFEEINIDDKVLICPTCKAPMVKFGKLTGVEFYACHVCGAEFFEHKELIKLLNK